jgi:DNA-binding transcriptional LysR family regulator
MLTDHLEKLKCFQAAAENGTFIAAAKALRLTQPGVTKNIRLLEEELGVSLFERHRRGVELTDAGKLLLQFSEQISLRAKDFEQQIRHLHELSGVLRIGTYETLGEAYWPDILLACQKKFPTLRIELTSQDSRMRQSLGNGGIDLIVDAEPETIEGQHSQVLYVDRFAVFALRGSKHLKQDKLPIAVVPKAIDRNGFGTSQHLHSVMNNLDVRYDLESFTMVRSFILRDVCIGVLPLRLAAPLLESGKLQKIDFNRRIKDFGEHRICVTFLESRRNEVRLKAIVGLLKENATIR